MSTEGLREARKALDELEGAAYGGPLLMEEVQRLAGIVASYLESQGERIEGVVQAEDAADIPGGWGEFHKWVELWNPAEANERDGPWVRATLSLFAHPVEKEEGS